MRSFKRIIKTVGIFLLAVCLLSALFIGCYLEGENFHYQDGHERDAISGEVTFLVCGASYTLFGIRPDVLNTYLGVNSYSLAGTLLTLRGRYTLLEQELARNPKVHTVLLEVSPDTLIRDRAEEGPKGDLPMLGRLNTASARWDYFRAAFAPEEWPEVYYDTVSKGLESALRLVTGSYETENRIMAAGYYENHNPDKYIPNNYTHLYKAQSLPETPIAENVEWLEKLVALCKQHGCSVYLITVPQSKYYNCVYSNLDFYEQWFMSFAFKHDIEYYNFNLAKDKLELLPDETCFYDETHLNAHGGEVFTKMLAGVVSQLWQGINIRPYFFWTYEELSWASNY